MKISKKILTIVLVALILVLGGASVFVATELSKRQAVAPTAPESKPAASETSPTPTPTIAYVSSAACAASGSATLPDEAVLMVLKRAYKDESGNTAGKYSLKEVIQTVGKDQVFVYAIDVKNETAVKASGVVVKDKLIEKNQDWLSFVDSDSRCSFAATNKELNCTLDVDAKSTETLAFRVRVSNTAVNGEVIANKATMTYGNKSYDATVEVKVSSLVSCNHTCTTNDECSDGLTCESGKCRNSACSGETDCTCTVATATPTRTVTTVVTTTAPTRVASVTATPTVLPETGIFDLPGVAAFGGGLLLAIVGILLAL